MIDITKKYKTRDGREAVIHTTSGPRENYPVVASIVDYSAEGGWRSASFTDDGRIYLDRPDNPLDLVEYREPREWKLVVATEENSVHERGYVDGQATEGVNKGKQIISLDLDDRFWKIVRVREIIEP